MMEKPFARGHLRTMTYVAGAQNRKGAPLGGKGSTVPMCGRNLCIERAFFAKQNWPHVGALCELGWVLVSSGEAGF